MHVPAASAFKVVDLEDDSTPEKVLEAINNLAVDESSTAKSKKTKKKKKGKNNPKPNLIKS